MQLTPQDYSAMSARFSPDGRRLVYVSHRAAVASGTHGGTAALEMIHWLAADAGGCSFSLAFSGPLNSALISWFCFLSLLMACAYVNLQHAWA